MTKSNTASTATGSCLCGGVAFTVSGKILPMLHCHCSMCRKTHGAAFATFFNAESLSWTKGEDLIVHYASSTSEETSTNFIRSFCSDCGSALPHRSNHYTGWSVVAGLMDDDPEVRPESHIFSESAAPWYEITDKLKQITAYGDSDQSRVVNRGDLTGKAGDGYTGGSCACGKVAFRFKGDAEFMMYCHCSRCRKVKGSAHATNVFVKPEQFEWTRGAENVHVYDLPDAERFGNSFCKDCGSSAPRKSENSPMYNIPAGSLDDSLNVEPKGHIYVGSKAPWYDITDAIAQHKEMPA